MPESTLPACPHGAARACLLGLLGVLLLLLAAAPAARAQRVARPNALGYNLRLSGDAGTQDQQVRAVAQSGESARHAIWWNEVEPSRGQFRWTSYDALVREVARSGLRLQVVLGFSAPWAASSPEWGAPPSDNAAFANYARGVAARYGRGGSFWQANRDLPYLPVVDYEVWNEPNDAASWRPAPNPAAYAQLYLAARAALKSVDPQARAITGGLAWHDAPPFVTAMYQQPGMRGNVDGVGFHPYGLTVEGSYALTRGVRQAVDAADSRSVPLELTELGWPTSPSNTAPAGSASTAWVSESTRAAYLERATSEYVRSDCNIGIVSVYSNIGPEANQSDAEDWFGIHNSNGSLKPSGAAYARALRQLAGRETGPTGGVAICYPAAAPPGPKKLKPRYGDWRRQACKIIKIRKQRRALRRFYKRYCKGRKLARLSSGPPPPDWRKRTCRLLKTKRRRRAFRSFYRRSCKVRGKRGKARARSYRRLASS